MEKKICAWKTHFHREHKIWSWLIPREVVLQRNLVGLDMSCFSSCFKEISHLKHVPGEVSILSVINTNVVKYGLYYHVIKWQPIYFNIVALLRNSSLSETGYSQSSFVKSCAIFTDLGTVCNLKKPVISSISCSLSSWCDF